MSKKNKVTIKEESDNDEIEELNEDDNEDMDNIDEEAIEDEEDLDDVNDEYIDNDDTKEELDIDYYDDNLNIKQNLDILGEEYLVGSERISRNLMTKYEMVRILGERTKQLRMGAKPLIKNYKDIDYDKIAEEELLNNMIPFKIKRLLPNGKYEIWNIDELNKNHLLYLLE